MNLLPDLIDYPQILSGLISISSESERTERLRFLSQNDLYFLLRYTLKRPDLEHPWLFARCREVQSSPDGYLDLWFREGYKSTIITFGLTILDLLNDPELTVGIFSHTRPIAKGFLRQIMREFATNDQLREWFPEIFWADPKRKARNGAKTMVLSSSGKVTRRSPPLRLTVSWTASPRLNISDLWCMMMLSRVKALLHLI